MEMIKPIHDRYRGPANVDNLQVPKVDIQLWGSINHITRSRPLAGYGLPPPRGNFVDHIFYKVQCLSRILQHVSPLTMAALSCNSLLHMLPYKIFDN